MYYVRIFPNWSNIDEGIYNFIPIGPFNSVEEAHNWYDSERERDNEEGLDVFCDMEMDVVERPEIQAFEHEGLFVPTRDPSVVRNADLWEAIEIESAKVIFIPNAG